MPIGLLIYGWSAEEKTHWYCCRRPKRLILGSFQLWERLFLVLVQLSYLYDPSSPIIDIIVYNTKLPHW